MSESKIDQKSGIQFCLYCISNAVGYF